MRRGKIWLALLLVVALCGNLLGCFVVGSGGETLGNAKTTEADNGNGTTNADNGSDSSSKDDSGQSGTGTLDTGNLTEEGNGYEGIVGTGNYNYGEALQKSLLFYELQRSDK